MEKNEFYKTDKGIIFMNDVSSIQIDEKECYIFYPKSHQNKLHKICPGDIHYMKFIKKYYPQIFANITRPC